MNARRKLHLQFAFALIYSAILVQGAIPYAWLPKSWLPRANTFADFRFTKLRIVPGMGVFNFTKNLQNFEIIESCFQVEVPTSSKTVEQPADYPCPLQKKSSYSFFQSPVRNFYYNVANLGMINGKSYPEKNIYAQALADYYCRKNEGQSASVSFSVYYQDIVSRALISQRLKSVTIDCAVLRSSS